MNKRNTQASWGLHDLVKCATLFGIEIPELSDDMTMRETKEFIENRILEDIHPYAINKVPSVPGQWMTQVPDPTKKNGRRFIRKMGYERLCHAIIEYYMEKMHLSMTMDILFEKWVIFRKNETSVKPGTIRKDLSLWRTHCREVKINDSILADWKVTDLTTKELYSFFRTLTKDRAYSKQMVKNIRGVLAGMFTYAVENDIITNNPVREVDLKRFNYKPLQNKQNDVFTVDDAQQLLAYLELLDEPYALAIRLDFNLFIRFGELAGLKWENVNLDKRTIFICHQTTYEPELNDDMTFTEKKMVTEDYLKGCTDQGYRTEYISDDAVDVLIRAKKINPEGEYVFMPRGKQMVNLTFNKSLKRYCMAAGVPYLSSHKIRFYAASVAYNGENLPAISKMMGHSNISTTLHYLRDVVQNDDYSAVFSNLGRQTG